MCRALIQLLLNAIFLNRVASARALRPPSAWIGAVPHLVTKRLKQVLVTGGEPAGSPAHSFVVLLPARISARSASLS
jgi:hypothetical protein